MSVTPMRPLDAPSDTLTEMVFEAIKDGIVHKSLPPGGRVSEAALAAQLKVSKTPVREALLRLRHIGLVRLTASGLRVVSPSEHAVQEAYELRAGLERMSAQLAATRAGGAAPGEALVAAGSSLECASAGDREGFSRWDGVFHRLVAGACGNGQLTSAIEDSLVLTSVLRVRDVPISGDSIACAQEHVLVAEAIQRRDGRAAADVMQAHIEHVMSMVLTALSDQKSG